MSDRLLTRLAALNPTVVFLVTLAVMLLGLFLPGIAGALVLLALAAGLGLLLSRTWSVLLPPMRAMRVLVLVLLVAAAVTKLV